ncbi:MAG: CPBP family intramembrane glutamic endopeptidase [Duganella sp.]
MKPPLSPARAICLLVRMRLLRQYNQLASAFSFTGKKKKTDASARSANGGKRNARWLLSLAVGAMMLFSLINMSRTALLTMQCRLVADSACAQTLASAKKGFSDRLASAELHGAAFDPALLTALAMVLAILFAIAVLLPLASKELAKPDGDLEWLVTLPVARSTLLWGRLIERSAGNLAGMFALFPLYLMIAWYSGHRWSAAPIALLATALLLPLAALLHTLADTGLRMWLAASQLRNLQALVSITNIPLIYLVIALGMPQASGFVMELVRQAPAWLLWLAPGLLLQLIQAHSLAQAGVLTVALLTQLGLAMWAGVALMRCQLRHGVVGSGVRESARSTAAAERRPRVTPAWLSNALSPVMRRELRLLARDRNFLVQTLLLPLIIVGSQMVFNGKLDTLAHFGQMPSVAAAIAFGIGVYVLMLSAFQTLNNEGNALWLLYTVPRTLESVLKEKARLWSVLALVYPLMIAAVTAASAPQLDWQLLVLLLIVVAGIPIYSTIAVALGVFACDPGATEVHKRIRPTYSYLFLLLTSFYTWSLYTSVWSQKVVILVLSAALALALWQKARDALPYLLDPTAAPPARVAAADGLMAATAFFILQAIIVLLITPDQQQTKLQPGMQVMTAAFGGAGLLVYAMMRLIYRRAQSVGVPRILGASGSDATSIRWWQPLRQAAAPCTLACALALAYLYGLRQLEVEIPATAAGMTDYLWMMALAVIAAPLCEEFIFRGLIYGGLRRSLPAWQAMAASAAIFAVVHPPLSMLPVFVLGLCTAWTYERSKTLLAPMLVHGAYNAVILLVT